MYFKTVFCGWIEYPFTYRKTCNKWIALDFYNELNSFKKIKLQSIYFMSNNYFIFIDIVQTYPNIDRKYLD